VAADGFRVNPSPAATGTTRVSTVPLQSYPVTGTSGPPGSSSEVTAFWVGVLSNIVSLLIVGAAVGVWYLLRRRPLLAFFGLQRRHRVVIYPSRLKVESSRGVDGTSRSFGAMATPEYEAKIIAEITGFFDRFTPRILRWLNALLLRWGDVKVDVAWPASKDEIEHECTFILLGSPGYNLYPRHSRWTSTRLFAS
jgi:hypothetical protein